SRLRRLGLMLNSCCSHSHSCSSLPCFDPCDVSVVVKDGKMTVSAERKEEHNSCLGRTSTHRKFIKEISLPP
ncbi:ODFP1 protein, partial [Bombycilla garrulus]|nr:ODFP1 protein [Bombycilla garrulus]